MIPNREESVRKLVKKLGPVEQLRFCYEAGPTGYALYWQLTKMGAKCEVVAPTLVPVKAGDRVKTGPPGCIEAGAELSSRRVDGGVGAGCGA
jgi:transposase